MRPIDADALMDNIKRDTKKAIDEGDKAGSFWLGYAAGSVIAQPTIQPEATDKVRFGDKDHVWIDGKQYISLRRFQEAVKEAQPKEGHWIEGGIYRDVIECNCSEIPNSSDTISRQAVIDALHTWFRDGFDEDKWWNSTHVLAAIEGLHPVQQEHKWETCFECPLSHGCPKIKGCTNEQAIEYASQIPNDCPLSAQPEPQWIPVEKELPEPRIDVWVNSDLGQMVGYYDEMVNLWYGRDYLELIVNAWMPLPEAYKPNK